MEARRDASSSWARTSASSRARSRSPQGLLEEFGEKRVRDTPISENTIVGMGVGAAMVGLRPVVELMTMNFSLLALDQIVNQRRVDPLHVRRPGQGADGDPHAPGRRPPARARPTRTPSRRCTCTSRACSWPCRPRRPTRKGLLKAAIRDDNPVIFIEHETLYGQKGEVPDDGEPLPLRRGRDPARGRRRDDRRASRAWP